MDSISGKCNIDDSSNEENEEKRNKNVIKPFCQQAVSHSSLLDTVQDSGRQPLQVRFNTPNYYPSTIREEEVEAEISVIDLEAERNVNSLSGISKDSEQNVININSTLDTSFPIVSSSRYKVYSTTCEKLGRSCMPPQTSDPQYKPPATFPQETKNEFAKNQPKVVSRGTTMEGTADTTSISSYTRSRSPTPMKTSNLERPDTLKLIRRDRYLSDIPPGIDSHKGPMRQIGISTDTSKQQSNDERKLFSKEPRILGNQTPSSSFSEHSQFSEKPLSKEASSFSPYPSKSQTPHSFRKHPLPYPFRLQAPYSKRRPHTPKTQAPSSPTQQTPSVSTYTPEAQITTSYSPQPRILSTPKPKSYPPQSDHISSSHFPYSRETSSASPQTQALRHPKHQLTFSRSRQTQTPPSSYSPRVQIADPKRKLFTSPYDVPQSPTRPLPQIPGQEGDKDFNAKNLRKHLIGRRTIKNKADSEDLLNINLAEEDPLNFYNYAVVYPSKGNHIPTEIDYLLSSLEKSGLKIKSVRGKAKFQDLVFVLLHLPIATLLKEAHKQRVPLSFKLKDDDESKQETWLHWITMCFAKKEKDIKKEVRPSATSAEKIMFIHQKLNTAKFGVEPEEYSIDEITRLGIIKTAYPLHDIDGQSSMSQPLSDRQMLISSWGSFYQFTRVQPLRLVNGYFGPEVAFYFAWMGYLACFLLPALIAGVLSFTLACSFRNNPGINFPGFQLCAASGTMCPLCANYKECSFSQVGVCDYGILYYIIDNQLQVLLTMFMGIWSIIFTIYWKKAQNELRFEWNLYRADVDYFVRSDFFKRLKTWKLQSTSETESRMSFIHMCILRIASMALMIGLIAIMWQLVLLIAQIRILLMHKLSPSHSIGHGISIAEITHGNFYSNIICSILSALFIIIISKLLTFAVNWLTILENPQTDTEYSVSYVSKLFLLECVNNYGVAYYMAFFREYKAGGPAQGWTYGGGTRDYNHMCDPAGCAVDFAFHVAIVLIVKILYNWITYGYLCFLHCKKNCFAVGNPTQWESDYELTNVNYNLYITTLYMEPVLKYGLMLMSVTLFNLGPLILFIDTVVTIRIHAKMFTGCLKRPVPRPVVDIGIWNKFFQFITVIGLATMVYVFAFVSNTLGQIVYQKYHFTSKGYFESTLSEFPLNETYSPNGPVACYFRGQQEPYAKRYPYLYTRHYYTEMAHRHNTATGFELQAVGVAVLFYYLTWNYVRERPYDEPIYED